MLAYATAGLFAALALWVVGARACDAVNRTLGALFLLMAGSTVAFEGFRGVATSPDALLYVRLFTWYELALPLLILLLVDGLFIPRPRPRPWRGLLVAVALVTVALAFVLVVRPDMFHTRVARGEGRFTVAPEPLAVAHTAAQVLAQTLAMWLAARTARAVTASPLVRRQAALVALAFALLLAHGAGITVVSDLTTLAAGAGASVRPAMLVAYLAAGAAVAYALPLMARAFAGREAVLVAALPVVAFAVGVFDGYLGDLRGAGVPVPYGYINSRPVWIAAFALTLAIAVIRYGLAGIDPRGRTHVAAVTTAVLAGIGAALAGLAGWLAGGFAGAGAGAGLAIMAVPLALAYSPLRAVPVRIAASVLAHPNDVEVVRERVRVYQGALRAALGADGDVAPAHVPVIEALRRELALTERDHEMLLAGLRSKREHAGDGAGLSGRGDSGPHILLGRYFVQRTLGHGATGTVYLARDSLLGREVVVKRLTGLGPEAASLATEAAALARLEHPRVVRLFGVHQAGHEVMLVLEHAPHGSLASRLEKGPLPPDEAVAHLLDVLEGLAAVHAAGMVHGDVKAANVLLGRDGRAKVADLGTARMVRVNPNETALLAPAAGSLGAMAPEQVLGEPATQASDVYAAGALLFRLLTGGSYVDIDGAPEREVRARVVHAPPRLPHEKVPATLEAVLRRALAKDAADRFPHVGAMADALRAARAAEPRKEPVVTRP